jgi:nucleotide-binding universal stress UspA family protein
VGIPHDELVFLTSQTGADLIVVGRQDLASSGWARIGTTAQRVIRKSSVPILLVAGAQDHGPARILLAVDESDMTDDVLAWGAFLVERFKAKGTVMHAAGMEEEEESGEWISAESAKVAGAASLQKVITRTAARPAESIIAEAKNTKAELVVIGSRGAGGANQMLFGSVAESVLLSSPCPVLVVLPPS